MISSKLVALSFAALSGIAISTILRKISSSLQNKTGLHCVEVDSNVDIKEGEDFFNQMPDEILVKILACLSTRDSVKTSILSRRWRKLYAFVPCMEFLCLHTFPTSRWGNLSDHTSRGLQERFINGVDTFLSLHSGSCIDSCILWCCFLAYFPNKLEEWIRSLGGLGIDNLNLNFVCSVGIHERIIFHSGFISLVPSLRYLDLEGCFLQPTSRIQPKRLTYLTLTSVTLSPIAVTCILSNCLNLESLYLEWCKTVDATLLRICGSNLQLKYLSVIFFRNIEKIEISANNLVSFKCFGHKFIKFSFEHVPNLESLYLILYPESWCKNPQPFSSGELAKDLPPVSVLHLQIYGQYYEMFQPVWFHGFRNVTHLLLGFSMFKPDQLSVALVLEMCPVLINFQLQIEKETSSACQGQQVSTSSLKYHNHLISMSFYGFSGTESEMDAAIYVISSAMVLKQMTISYCFSIIRGDGTWKDMGKAPLSKERRETIETVLRGHAISKNANVVVEPIYLSDIYKSI